MNTYCDDCKRCTGGNMRKTDVPGGDDHNRCWECEATIQAGMAEADAMISDLRAERDALRERCEKLEHELGMSKRNEARWIEKGEEAISERNAANKALEAIKRHQEIVAGTGTAQLSTTWKIANDYLRSKGAALSATEVKP